MRIISFFFIGLTWSIIAYSQSKTPAILFEVVGLKKEYKHVTDLYFDFRITNKSSQDLLIPNVFYFNNVMNRNIDLDIGFELCKLSGNEFKLNDSCNILSQPRIPEEGYKLKHYQKNSSFYYPSMMPLSCLLEKGSYRIRFTYFPRNKGYSKIQSEWYFFTVLKEML